MKAILGTIIHTNSHSDILYMFNDMTSGFDQL